MGDRKIRILLVEDDKIDQMAFARFVSDENLPYEYTTAGSVAEFKELITSQDFDIVIADYMLGDGTLFNLFHLLNNTPVIVTTGAGNEEIAVNAMKSGACDYLIKDFEGCYLQSLPFTVESAVRQKKTEKELETYRRQLEQRIKTRTADLESEIVKRKQARAALKENEEHLRSLMESATDFAIYRLVSDEQAPLGLRVVFVSPSIKDILGIDEPMQMGNWFEGMHPDDVDRIAAANRKAFETHRFDEEYRIFNSHTGTWRWIHAISTGGTCANGWNMHVNGILFDITDKQVARQELEGKAQSLEELNTALNVLLEKRENDRATLEQSILGNIEQMVLPYLEKIERGTQDANQKALVDILRRNLSEMTTTLPKNLSSLYLSLTQTEFEVANFIKHGKRTKEIAGILNISPKTVKNHRQKIRVKAGIANTKINLRSYLMALQ